LSHGECFCGYNPTLFKLENLILGDLNTVNLNVPAELANVTSDEELIRINSTVLDLTGKAKKCSVVKII